MIGRLLCLLGHHKWDDGQPVVLQWSSRLSIYGMVYDCTRPGCDGHMRDWD